jgi:hypothetical protein
VFVGVIVSCKKIIFMFFVVSDHYKCVLFASDHWHVICCSWSLMWCLLQLIFGVMLVAADNCHIVVVAYHWHVVCCSWLLAYCLLQLIVGVVFVAADYWNVFCFR